LHARTHRPWSSDRVAGGFLARADENSAVECRRPAAVCLEWCCLRWSSVGRSAAADRPHAEWVFPGLASPTRLSSLNADASERLMPWQLSGGTAWPRAPGESHSESAGGIGEKFPRFMQLGRVPCRPYLVEGGAHWGGSRLGSGSAKADRGRACYRGGGCAQWLIAGGLVGPKSERRAESTRRAARLARRLWPGRRAGDGGDRVRRAAGNEAIARENEANPARGKLRAQSVAGNGP